MTGTDILRQAYTLLNYTDANGNVNAANNANLSKRALPIINQIYADLWQPRMVGAKFEVLSTMNQPLDLDDYTAINIMPYGVAMMLAQSDGDVDNQSVYASLYNQRRAGAVTTTDRIIDKLPRTYL
ncbi:MAG: hypothetical protein IJO75_01230 [Clostridia bacterium]|nr:hypothetical protein [Clostridia bacterium]MBQ9860859.1 hypothetical protein [Clostridia bacterium]